jgi:hypothetical protein
VLLVVLKVAHSPPGGKFKQTAVLISALIHVDKKSEEKSLRRQ